MPNPLPSKRRRDRRRSSYPLIHEAKKQRSTYLEDPRWRPYRNSPQLALQVYELTHPENVMTFDGLERSKDANQLALYQSVALRLSEMLAKDPAAEHFHELANLQKSLS
ncbi:hypothetical protein [Synechococcus sp. PCC 7335]|uniref:hypothetical protein n=1 Tax=Synechococcus sp. (strain ATCC 29403 / PCC 7335) TaxID=91464 RepID=UPI0005701012|nr:hypothetical protein [Synechococcus sp. PCC 7335]